MSRYGGQQAGARRQPGAALRPAAPAARGFALVSVVFLLVVVAAAVAGIAALVVNSTQSVALDVQASRAQQAARAGLQWAAWQLLDPRATLDPGADAPPACFTQNAAPTLPEPLSGFEVVLSCARTPAIDAVPPYHLEESERIAVYMITASASIGAPGSPDRVERRLQMQLEVCKDPSSSDPGRACVR